MSAFFNRYRRLTIVVFAAMCVSTAGIAQYDQPVQGSDPIQWMLDWEQAVMTAQKQHRPLMGYVLRSSSNRDEDLERAQKRVFNDPRVQQLAKRYVPVKMSMSQQRDVLKKWGLPADANLYIVFATPTGEKLDDLAPSGLTNVDSTIQKMSRCYQIYRKQIYEKELKDKLESESTSAGELMKALSMVQQMNLVEADASVVKVVERKGIDKKAANEAYETLARLSTKISVTKLIELTREKDAAAIKALGQCNPGAAEYLAPSLTSDDQEEKVAAYLAVVKICKVKDAKPEKFFSGKNARIIEEEIQRVKKLAEKAAARWKEQNDDAR
ncbi:MAG: hypothetical protein JNG88_06485 [Phycisphaerales bacterium]|nr:hypothetical protein [Phycisphaerales bacterium]